MQWISATKVGIISASLPVFIFLLSWLVGVEKIGRHKLWGLALSLSGVAFVIVGGKNIHSGLLASLTPGDGLILTSIIVFAFYSVYLKRLTGSYSITGFLFVNIFIGWFGIAPFYLYDVYSGNTNWPLNNHTISVLAYVATFPSIISGILWLKGIRLGGPALGGISYNFLPVIASLLAVIFLGEGFTIVHFVGITLVLAGVNFERIVKLFSQTAEA